MSLVFSDLFAYADRSIASIQIHDVNGRTVVLVTEPSDNPGQSSINAAESLNHRLQEVFPELVAFRIFVRLLLDPENRVWIELLPGDDEMGFRRDVTAEEVEALCPAAGESAWNMEDPSCAALGGAGHPLLALVPPPEPE